MIDYTGHPSSQATHIGVIVSKLDEAHPALHGFMGFVDWAGHLIVGNVHRPDRMQSWLTHFAIIIEFDKAGSKHRDLWLLERGVDGVIFRPIRFDDNESFHREFTWNEWHHCDGHFPQSCSGSSKVLCNVHCNDEDSSITREQVLSFVREQVRYDYNIVEKNCKHLAYDFYRHMQHAWAKDVDFPIFTESMETAWVNHRGW